MMSRARSGFCSCQDTGIYCGRTWNGSGVYSLALAADRERGNGRIRGMGGDWRDHARDRNLPLHRVLGLRDDRRRNTRPDRAD